MADFNRELYNGWIIQNVNGRVVRENINGVTMDQIGDFENGIAQAMRLEGITSKYYIVTDHGDILANIPTEKFSSALRIAREPSEFLNMPTRYFEDKLLVEDLLIVAKNSLKRDIEKAQTISDDYLQYVKDLHREIKEKIEKENQNLRTIGKSGIANKNEALDIVNSLGKEI